jgi:hypothetical protein
LIAPENPRSVPLFLIPLYRLEPAIAAHAYAERRSEWADFARYVLFSRVLEKIESVKNGEARDLQSLKKV